MQFALDDVTVTSDAASFRAPSGETFKVLRFPRERDDLLVGRLLTQLENGANPPRPRSFG
jgi:hypothetical protein